MNTTVCDTTGHTPAYLLFGRELRTVDDVVQDFKSVVHNDNFVAEITPYLKRFATITEDIRERIETKQDQRKSNMIKITVQSIILLEIKFGLLYIPSVVQRTRKLPKFMPKRDGPYLILTPKSPTYVIASLANPSEPIATYHTSALTPVKDINTSPVAPLRKRGRPRKVTSTSQNKHVPSPSTATTAVSNRTIRPSTRATTTTANYVSSPGRLDLIKNPFPACPFISLGHTARATIDLLKDTFGDHLISRFEPVNWPPRSCDLTPLDYFLWGYVKSLVYADKPQTLDHLEDNIRRVSADRRPQMLEKVIENWTSRLDYIRASRGSPMPEIIFKMKTRRDLTGAQREKRLGSRETKNGDQKGDDGTELRQRAEKGVQS
ncbi:gag-Pol polyprotein [Trichonephila clavipes]|nr:gag-Pol polyprotein [Trichonephila clavipes]